MNHVSLPDYHDFYRHMDFITDIYMCVLLPISAKSPYEYRHNHTGMGPQTCMVFFYHRMFMVTKI